MGLAESLELVINANPASAVGAFDKISSASEKSLRSTESNVQRISATVAKIGAGGVGVGGLLTELGSKEQEAAGQLQAAIGQVGQSYSEYADKVEQAEKSQVRFGNTAAETKGALTTLTLAYGDTDKALNEMQLVTDLAARKHISLGEAATIVAKAHGGAGRVFKEFGIQVKTNTDGTKDYDGALSQLAQKLQGQASASADTVTGKFKALRAEVENAVASFGQNFGPAILGISSLMTVGGGAINGITTAVKGLAASESVAAVASSEFLVSLGGFGALVGVAAGAAYLLSSAFGSNHDRAVDSTTAVQAYTEALKTNTQTALTSATANLLVGSNAAESAHKVAESLRAAGVPLIAFTNEVSRGTGDLGRFAQNSNVFAHSLTSINEQTGETKTALQRLAEGGSEFAKTLLDAYNAGKLTDDQLVLIIRTANDLSGNLDSARVNTDLLNSAQQSLGVSLDSTGTSFGTATDKGGAFGVVLKDLTDAAKTAQDAIDAAASAAHQLLDAGLQQEYAPLDIADAQSRAADAQNTLNDARKSGDPKKLAQAQRDYDRATLDVTRTVNSAAQAEANYKEKQLDAQGVKHDAIADNNIYITALQDLTQYVNGPYSQAIQAEITQQTYLNGLYEERNAANEQYFNDLQQIAAGNLSEPTNTSPITPRGYAIGGQLPDVTMAEYGPEFVRNGWVYPTTSDMTREALTGAQNGGSATLADTINVNVVAPTTQATPTAVVRGLRRAALLNRPR